MAMATGERQCWLLIRAVYHAATTPCWNGRCVWTFFAVVRPRPCLGARSAMQAQGDHITAPGAETPQVGRLLHRENLRPLIAGYTCRSGAAPPRWVYFRTSPPHVHTRRSLPKPQLINGRWFSPAWKYFPHNFLIPKRPSSPTPAAINNSFSPT